MKNRSQTVIWKSGNYTKVKLPEKKKIILGKKMWLYKMLAARKKSLTITKTMSVRGNIRKFLEYKFVTSKELSHKWKR